MIDQLTLDAIQDPRFLARFWAKVHKTDSCWLWTGCRPHGYGHISLPNTRRVATASRVSWMISHGAIPDRLHVLHNCPDGDNPACVNPDHLYLGTHAQNCADAVRKGQSPSGTRNARAVLTEDVVRQIRNRPRKRGDITKWAREFGMSRSGMWAVVSGENWPLV